MKIASLSLIALLACASGIGCNANAASTATVHANVAEADGLRVRIELPKAGFVIGETFTATVTADNITGKDITIEPTSGAQVHLRLWRETSVGWDQVKRYPQTATAIVNRWTLPAGQKRVFAMEITIDHSWPTSEPLRLSGNLNGAKAAAGVIIRVNRAIE